MAPPLLELRSFTCERDDYPLFAPVSCAIAPGDIAQLEGANGVGKTSLLRAVCGLSSRGRGELLWRGKTLACQRAQFATEVIYLGHAAGLKGPLSARENLRWWAAIQGRPAAVDVDAALARVGLVGFEESPCQQLSAGQQRRVALARLFLAPAALWVLDEPFTAIDRHGAALLERWLVEQAARGGAVLLTTHQPLALTRPVTRIVLLPGVADDE